MASFLALGCIFVVGWLIIQRYKSQAVLLMAGLTMMAASYLLGIKADFVPARQATGFWLFDIFEYVNRLASIDVAGLGMMIMVCTGFAKYMDHIGASTRLVSLAVRPLSRLKAPYLVMMLGYLVNNLMSLPVPSASGLAMLMMVTLFPILTGLGISRPAAASAIVTGHLLDWGPASATSLLVSKTADIPLTQYFIEYQVPVYAACGLSVAVAHYLWQKHLDKKEGLYMDPDAVAAAVATALATSGATAGEDKQLEKNAPGPMPYILLPLLPIVFLLGFSEYGHAGIKMNVNLAMFLSLAVAMGCELLRWRGDLRKVCASIHVFFKGMGDQFTMTVTLITAGQTFAYGLQCLGVVAAVIETSQTLGLSAWMLTFLASIVLLALSMIMGSGVAPLFAFVPLMPKFAADLGVPNAVVMMLPLQNAACLGRLLSPITAAVVAVATLAEISPFELVKRNIVPVLVGFAASTVASRLLFW